MNDNTTIARFLEKIENMPDLGRATGGLRPGKWIPVTVMLPEGDEIVLVSCRSKKGVNSVNRAYYADGSWHGSGSMSRVTAWMLLPEPFTEDI